MVGLDHKTYKCLPTQLIAQAQFPLAYIFFDKYQRFAFFFSLQLYLKLYLFIYLDIALLKTLYLSEGDLAKKNLYIYIHNHPNKNITNIL